MLGKDAISVLLLDDNADVAALYKSQVEQDSRFAVTIQTDGRRAKTLAERQLFDVIVIDAKLDYKGIEFGGLRLADDLKPRYGANSILVISRYITTWLLREYQAEHEFLPKPTGDEGATFGQQLRNRMADLRQRQYVFVAMPFSEGLEDVYREGIKPAARLANLRCVRGDEVSHTRRIHDVIFELIQNAKLVVFLADEANANAYYEAGFADSMRKEVIVVAKSLDELKFDVNNRDTIVYGDSLSALPEDLSKRILGLRFDAPLGV